LDFSGLRSSASDSFSDPRQIFAALPEKAAKYAYARDVQSEVWDRWYARRHEDDLVIKMNTGGGKTVVGLIALKSCLNEGVGPAAYFTPDHVLAGQVRDEAAALGVAVTDEPNDPSFRRGHAILVTVIQRLVNAQSVFGVRGIAYRPMVDVGSILIDDAHACLSLIQKQFTLTIRKDHPAYTALLSLFTSDLRTLSDPTFRDIETGDFSAVMPVPYWAWQQRQTEALELLHPHRDSGDEFRFTWNLISDVLPLCRVAISAEQIEIAPPVTPIEAIPSFRGAARRLYLTATLADDSILVTHFGADPATVGTPIHPVSASDVGDRMILMPQQTFAGATDAEVMTLAAQQAQQHNVVVIAPSAAKAARWAPLAVATHLAPTIEQGVAALRAGHVGLVVLVNRYDGIDLPDDACRVLVLDGLPEAQSVLERLEAVALTSSRSILMRQVQRIEQGMGRGVRSNEDHCVVILLGKRLTERLYPPAARAMLSPATAAQLKLSDQVAAMLQSGGRTPKDLPGVIEQCLSRDPDWVSASRSTVAGLTYPAGGAVPALAEAEREAFDLASQRRYVEAAETLLAHLPADDPERRGILREQAAAYMHHADRVRSAELQLAARRENRSALRRPGAVSYKRLPGAADQGIAASHHLMSTYTDARHVEVGLRSLVDLLQFNPDPNSVNAFEQAMCDLGTHLGFTSERPERDHGLGPDVMWVIGPQAFLIIECKSAATADVVPRKDVEQLGHSLDWFAQAYPGGSVATGLLIHPSRRLKSDAVARDGVRMITRDKLADLRASVERFAASVATGSYYADPTEVAKRLVAEQLNGPCLVSRWSVLPRRT
jgi:hypothetical protein